MLYEIGVGSLTEEMQAMEEVLAGIEDLEQRNASAYETPETIAKAIKRFWGAVNARKEVLRRLVDADLEDAGPWSIGTPRGATHSPTPPRAASTPCGETHSPTPPRAVTTPRGETHSPRQPRAMPRGSRSRDRSRSNPHRADQDFFENFVSSTPEESSEPELIDLATPTTRRAAGTKRKSDSELIVRGAGATRLDRSSGSELIAPTATKRAKRRDRDNDSDSSPEVWQLAG